MSFDKLFPNQTPIKEPPYELFKSAIGAHFTAITGLTFFPNLEGDTIWQLNNDKWSVEEICEVLKYKWAHRATDEFLSRPGMFSIRYIFNEKSRAYCRSLADELMQKEKIHSGVMIRASCGAIVSTSDYSSHAAKCFAEKGGCFFKEKSIAQEPSPEVSKSS